MKEQIKARREFLAASAGVSLTGLVATAVEGQSNASSTGGQDEPGDEGLPEQFVPNAAIEQARLVALELLKPSQKENRWVYQVVFLASLSPRMDGGNSPSIPVNLQCRTIGGRKELQLSKYGSAMLIEMVGQ